MLLIAAADWLAADWLAADWFAADWFAADWLAVVDGQAFEAYHLLRELFILKALVSSVALGMGGAYIVRGVHAY